MPEISYCGKTEAELTQSSVPYEVGMARYCKLTRGAIVGDSYGMLKLLVSTKNRTLLGMHVFGTNTTDLVHIGQAIMGCGGAANYLVDTVFNYPHSPGRTRPPRWTSRTRSARWTRPQVEPGTSRDIAD